jgi:AbrB family looped-hinge helix DNA binding protein
MVPVAREVRLSTKGQIVIPIAVRQRMRLKAGARLVLVEGDGEATLMTPRRYAERLRGAARGTYGKTRADVDAYVREERRAWPR